MLLDVDIRDPLFYYLESVYGKIRVLEEKVIGRARADFFMITENAFEQGLCNQGHSGPHPVSSG